MVFASIPVLRREQARHGLAISAPTQLSACERSRWAASTGGSWRLSSVFHPASGAERWSPAFAPCWWVRCSCWGHCQQHFQAVCGRFAARVEHPGFVGLQQAHLRSMQCRRKSSLNSGIGAGLQRYCPGFGGWHAPLHVAVRCQSQKKAGLVSGLFVFLVETRRIELPTFALRTRRSPS